MPPVQDEQERLASFSGPTEGLVPAEAFMLGVLPIPALRDRLQAIIFLHGFHSRTTAASNAARLVTAACTEVRDSALLRSILKTALAIGNFLNAGNRNGSAVGFQVDSLLKLKDVRSTRARSRTLLHFLAREVARKHPNGASLAAELPSCRAAARVSLSDLRAELDALADGIEAAHRAGRAGGADPASMDELLTAATERLAGVNGLVVEADASFLELRSFFNGKESTMDDPAAFFALMTTFSQQLDAAHSDNAAADARAGKQSTRPSSAPAQRRKTSPEPGKVEGGAPSPPLAAATVAEPEVTPPMKRQEKVLATIRLYSRMSNDQRRALLTDEGTKERLKGLDLTHRHSLAVPTLRQVAAAPSPAPPGGAPATRRGALLASAPAVSIADLMAKTAAAAEGNCKGSLAEEGGKVQQLEAVVEEQESPPAHAELEPEPEPSPGASKETHQQEEHANAAVQSQSVAVPPVAGLSSPVVRALRASRSLMESVHLRGSIDAASPASDAPQGEASLAASPEPSHGSTERQSEDDLCSSGVSLSRGALPMQEAPTPVLLRAQRGQVHSPAGEETQQARRNEAPLPLNQSYEQRMPAMGSPVNVARSAEDSPSPAVLRASGSSALFREKTPAVSLLAAPRQLDCSVELQPVPGARVWESTTTGLELADGEGLDDDAWEVASVATSDANPMRSAPDSPRYDLGQGQYSSERSTARDGASSREEGPAEWDSHDVSTSPEEQQRQLEEAMEAAARRSVGILRNSSEWAGQVAKLGGGLRSSKRVSFSLPNSPRDVVVDEGVAPQADTAGEGRPEGQERSQPDVSGLDLSLAMKLMANAAQVRRSWQGGEAAAGPEPSVQGVETEAHGAGEGGITQEYDEGVESQGAGEEDIAQGDEEREDVRASIEGQAAAVLRAALAAEMRRSLPGLPGVPADALPGLPLGLSPLNIDAFMAAVIANAGNTPTGPLARGVRQGDQHLFDDAAAEALREAARARSRADPNPHQRKALLEPIVPAPLGMGVRASETVAQGISPSTLRHSLEAHLAASILPARTATVAATRDLEMDAEGDATEQYDGEHYLDEEDVDQQYPGESSYGLEGEEAWGQRDEEPAEEGGSDGEEGEVDDDAMAGEAWAPVHEDRRLSRKVHSSLANERLSMWQSYSGRSR